MCVWGGVRKVQPLHGRVGVNKALFEAVGPAVVVLAHSVMAPSLQR